MNLELAGPMFADKLTSLTNNAAIKQNQSERLGHLLTREIRNKCVKP